MSNLTSKTICSLSRPKLASRLSRQTYGNISVCGLAVRNFSSSRPTRESISEVKVTDRMSLKDRNVFVTGGGRGIGFGICKAIAQLGGNVAVIDALPEPVEEFHTLETKYGTKTFYQSADVTQRQSLESAFSEAAKVIGPFQGCIPAAGIALDKPIADHMWAESQRVLMVNTMGTFWTVKLMADHMREHGAGGSIVLIASVAAQGIKVPEQNISIYNMSKAAVKGLVGPLAVELSEFDIRVNSISPGCIQSPMTMELQTKFPSLLQMFENSAPAGRMGIPEDLTPAVIYLLSDASSFTTGADFSITGGLHAGIRPSWMHRAMPTYA